MIESVRSKYSKFVKILLKVSNVWRTEPRKVRLYSHALGSSLECGCLRQRHSTYSQQCSYTCTFPRETDARFACRTKTCVTHFAHRCSVIAAMFGCRPWNPDSVSLSAGSAQIRALRPATPQICRTLPTFQPLHKGSRLCSRPTCVVAFAEGETAVLGLKRRRAASAAWAPC